MKEITKKDATQPKEYDFVFGKINYILMIAGLVVLFIGYILLCGGGSDDPQVFNYARFDFRRLVVAPIVIVAGIVLEVIAIMGKFKA